MKLKLIHVYDTKVITYHSGGGKRGIYILSTLGKIVTPNVFRLINTCIESATELELIDRIISPHVSEGNPELVKKLIDNPILRDIVLEVTKKEYER